MRENNAKEITNMKGARPNTGGYKEMGQTKTGGQNNSNNGANFKSNTLAPSSLQ